MNYFDQKASDWDKNLERADRVKKIYNRIIEIVDIDKDDTVLDFGCGTGSLGFNFIKGVKTVCFADTSNGMLGEVERKAQEQKIKNYKTINLDEETIQERFRLIVSLLAFHHIDNFKEALKELLKQIDDGGYMVVSDLDIEDGTFHYPQKVPHNGIDRDIILKCLIDNNYQVICNETIYIQEKIVNEERIDYPIFLIIGRASKDIKNKTSS